jgi:hypothetical protein
MEILVEMLPAWRIQFLIWKDPKLDPIRNRIRNKSVKWNLKFRPKVPVFGSFRQL